MSHLREQGNSCLNYIDDCLVISYSQEAAHADCDALCNILVDLRFAINYKKSIVFVGYVINSDDMIGKPTTEKLATSFQNLMNFWRDLSRSETSHMQ